MASYLYMVPHNVLTHIAFLSASSNIFEPPTDILHLSLSSRRIYNTLSPQACPHLYADLYPMRFDLAAPIRRFCSPGALTSSSLCAEFVQRCRVLRRIRRRDVSSKNLAQDLFTIYMMILESDGLNEMQLTVAGFSRYITMLLRTRPLHSDANNPVANEIASLAVSLLCLAISREEIINQGVRERDEMRNLIHPFAVMRSKLSCLAISRASSRGSQCDTSPIEKWSWLEAAGCPIIFGPPSSRKVIYYSQPLATAWPNIALASVILTFALNEAQTLQMPCHLPSTRVVADVTQRVGPTTEDYRMLAVYRTFLVGDTAPSPKPDCTFGLDCVDTLRSRAHDQDFSRIAQVLDPDHDVFSSEISAYVPGALSGLWEGAWMQASFGSSSSPAGTPSFLCRQPMQCFLREHLCFVPNVPLPSGGHLAADDNVWGFHPHQLTEIDDGFDLNAHAPGPSRQFCYEPFLAPSSSSASDAHRSQRALLDIVVRGETLPEHDKAWGAYRFAGRVRLQDGLIVLKREPKSDGDDGFGTWIFEGYLHSGGTLAGRWYSSSIPDHCSIEGSFCMTKHSKRRG